MAHEDLNSFKNIRVCGLAEGNENASLSFQYHNQCLEISLSFHKTIVVNELTFEIEFECPITEWRNHDYTWVDCNSSRIANYYSPKILKLKNGTKVIAGSTDGIWHYKKEQTNRLYWSITEPGGAPLFQYGDDNIRNFFDIGKEFKGSLTFKLFFTRNSVMEWSRSFFAFSGILCFTDHCDFDTLVLLQKERELFKQNNIKVTKGFFQYHFSKRPDNASFDKPDEREEYLNWINDGHELAYHSLTQTKKPGNEPFADFNKFVLSDADVITWIDHGYQPYNFTLIRKHAAHYSMTEWIQHVKSKGIKYLWNYIDSGESSIEVINQLSPESFRYGNVLMGGKKNPPIKMISEYIRLYLFYYSNETTLLKYRKLSSLVKNLKYKKNGKDIIRVFSYLLKLSREIASALFPGRKTKSAIPHFAINAPCIFEIYDGTENAMTIFQTVAVKDFIRTFSQQNLDRLAKEGGLCIAHTYFAILEPHHYGKMFLNRNGDISDEISVTFQNIGKSIEQKLIWNPTLKELAEYFGKFKYIEYELAEKGNILRIKNRPETSEIPVRMI